jgi:serine/threonine protein kinase/Tol biopolymer transport system component
MRLGVYDIVAPIGEGGMGQVYRATDSRLKRQVAIKVLPPSFATDTDRLARFQREAEVLASLNHPNIASIYGLEESEAMTALVMELVDGDDLSQRIARGAMPPDEAVPIARQIAEALDAAHEQGIIHRDLKPANIKVRGDGMVKVLDFGLARAMQPAAGSSPNLSMSPTIATPAMTQMGMILGTAAYMAPEQAKGRAVDKRADIWAFGCVLYELLAGKPAFPGEDITEILAAILKSEPDWDALPPGSPIRLLRLCLEKDPRRRLRDLGDLGVALVGPERPAAAPPVRRRSLVWALASMAAASLVLAIYALSNRAATVQRIPARFNISLPPGQEITSYPALTRDGQTIAYVTQQGTDDPLLYLRDLNSFEARPVPGSKGARQPFFAPDGKWVAFFAQGQLQKAEVAGGAPVRLAEAGNPMGGTWNDDNTIIYAASLGSGLLRLPASGGRPTPLTKPDGAANGYAHVFPQALPGGSRVLFTIWGQTQGNAVLSLDSHQWEMVLPLTATSFGFGIFDAMRGTTGRLLVTDPSAGVMAAPFDAAHPAPTSADRTVLANVFYDVENEARAWLAVSDTRTAVYVAGNPAKTSLVWVDREGKIESLGKDQEIYREAILSPDGTKAVVRQGLDLWIHDLQRGARSPLTSGNASNMLPVWSADGLRVLFASNRGGDWDIYSQPVDGSRPAEALLKRPSDQFPYSTLPDGTVLYAEIHPKTARDLWTLSPDGKTTPFRVSAFNDAEARFSPVASSGPGGSSRWVAYSSDESGRNEIYLQSYPGGTKRSAVSNGGGSQPRWSPDGKELFYVTGDAVVAVDVRPDGSVGAPRRLFDRSNFLLNYRYQMYQAAPDGKRFLMIRRDAGSVPRQLNVILNWSGDSDRPAQSETK